MDRRVRRSDRVDSLLRLCRLVDIFVDTSNFLLLRICRPWNNHLRLVDPSLSFYFQKCKSLPVQVLKKIKFTKEFLYNIPFIIFHVDFNLPESAAQTKIAQHGSSLTSFSWHKGSSIPRLARMYGEEQSGLQFMATPFSPHMHFSSQFLTIFSPMAYVRFSSTHTSTVGNRVEEIFTTVSLWDATYSPPVLKH